MTAEPNPWGVMAEFPALRHAVPRPADDTGGSLFGRGRQVVRAHPVATDALLAVVLLIASTAWLAGSRFAGVQAALVQAALIAPVAARRACPSAAFLLTCVIAFAQWLYGVPLIGDGALLVALYTVAAHQPRARAAAAAALLEAGAVMAAVRWEPAGTLPRSLLFLTAKLRF